MKQRPASPSPQQEAGLRVGVGSAEPVGGRFAIGSSRAAPTIICKLAADLWVVRGSSSAGFLNIELLVAIAILAAVLLPLGGAWYHETRMLRTYYHDAVAMEILDGEMEMLTAGEWRSFAEGRHPLKPTAHAATNLPPGQFILTREPQRLRLEWLPERGRKMAREIKLP